MYHLHAFLLIRFLFLLSIHFLSSYSSHATVDVKHMYLPPTTQWAGGGVEGNDDDEETL